MKIGEPTNTIEDTDRRQNRKTFDERICCRFCTRLVSTSLYSDPVYLRISEQEDDRRPLQLFLLLLSACT